MAPYLVDWSHRGFERTDVAWFFVCATLFLSIRWVLLKLVFYRLARWLLAIPSDTDKPKEVRKITKYLWHGLVYIILWVWALHLFTQQSWTAFNIRDIWAAYPHALPIEKHSLKAYMLLQASWYGHGLVESLLIDSSRTDFFMLLIHHVLAVALLAGAYWANAHRVAICVCFEQDFSDAVLYICKIAKDAVRFPFLQRGWVVTLLTLCVWLSWFSTRIVLLGMLVFTAYQYHIPSGILDFSHKNFDWLSAFLVVELTLLLGLQVIWWAGISKMTWSQVTKGTFTDFWNDGVRKKHL